jgi:hypothetical protein
MQTYHSWTLAAALAVGSAGLVGCACSSHSDRHDTTTPKQLSDVPTEQWVNPSDSATDVTAIQLYDYGAYDSTTGNGAPRR